MIYEVRTLNKDSKLYKASGYPTIDIRAVIQHQFKNPPNPKDWDWAYSLYFSNDPQVCAGYIPDCEPEKYLIEITLNRPIEYIFTDDSKFSTGGVSSTYMESTVVPNTSNAIYRHTSKKTRSNFQYPTMPFMQELGQKGFAFADIMVNDVKKKGQTPDIQYEIIIPHLLLLGDAFTQKTLEYKMNERNDGFEWVGNKSNLY